LAAGAMEARRADVRRRRRWRRWEPRQRCLAVAVDALGSDVRWWR
jgi:hypothetical protein